MRIGTCVRCGNGIGRLVAGDRWQDNDLVFATDVGTPTDPSNLRRAFARLTKSVGLGHWHPREMRHSAASILSAAGVPLEHVADVLGHDGTRMTALVYRHAMAPTVAAGVGPMEALFGSPGEPIAPNGSPNGSPGAVSEGA